jgi:hypothetical protein
VGSSTCKLGYNIFDAYSVLSNFRCFSLVQLRARGRATRGVRAMRLRGNDKLAAMDIAPASLLHT